MEPTLPTMQPDIQISKNNAVFFKKKYKIVLFYSINHKKNFKVTLENLLNFQLNLMTLNGKILMVKFFFKKVKKCVSWDF